jgi:hypothetical protein
LAGDGEKIMTKRNYSNFSALFIVLIYFALGMAWIYFSDAAVTHIAKNSDQLQTFQTYKGFFYVFLTSIILYLLVSWFLYAQFRQYLDNLETIEIKNELQESLAKTHAMYKDLFDNMLDSVAHCQMIYEESIPVDYEYIEVNKIWAPLKTHLKS